MPCCPVWMPKRIGCVVMHDPTTGRRRDATSPHSSTRDGHGTCRRPRQYFRLTAHTAPVVSLPAMRRSSVFVLALTLGTSLHHPAASRAAVGQKLPGCTRWQSRLQQLEQSGEDPASRRLRVLRNRIADGCVALNEIQVLGTHNSYHVQPRPALLAALLQIAPAFDAWEYTHPPLGEQFSNEGIRQIELDVWADPHGGLFARRGGLTFINEDPNSGPPELDALDAEILSVFPRHRLITPDDVRRGRASLEEAVLTLGWPRLGLARGKVLFTFDNGGAIRDAYLAGHPSLAGRILFTDS